MVLITFARRERRAEVLSRGGVAWHSAGAGTWTGRDRRGRFVGLVERIDGGFVGMDAEGGILDPRASLVEAVEAVVGARPKESRIGLIVHLVGAAGSIAVLVGVIDIVARSI